MSRPLGSTATPASSGFAATTGRSASERRDWYSMPPVSAVGTFSRDHKGLRPRTPYRRSPSHVPCKSRRPGSRRLYAGHRLARTRDTRQALSREVLEAPRFRCHPTLSTPQRRRPDRQACRALLERLPGPHLTRSSRAFSLNAHHDGLQPTQHQGGLAPTPEGRRWRADDPPSLAQHRL